MASTDARPVPQKNVAYRVTFPILDAAGDLVTAAGSLDSEVSIDAGTFADCTNEATEIATASGMYYLDLTSGEMNGDTVAIIVKSTGGKTVPVVLYPEEAGDMRADVTHWSGTAVAAVDTAGYPKVTIKDGTGAGEIALTSGAVDSVTTVATATAVTTVNGLAANVITAASLAADAGAEIADAVWDEAIAGHAGAGSTGEALSDAGGAGTPPTAAEVADAVWDEARSGHVAAGSFGAANQLLDEGTASSVTATGLTVAGSFEDDALMGAFLEIVSATTGAGQGRIVASNVGSAVTVATFDPALTGTVTYRLYAGSPAETAASIATAVRTELATELARVDVDVSSRADGADYTQARAVKIDNLDATISSRSTVTTAQVNTECDTAITDAALVTKLDAIDTVVDAILVDTVEIGTAGAGLTALASAANLATVDGIVDSILVDTAVIGAAGAGLTAVPWNAAWDAEVESEATDALVAYDPPTHTEVTTAVGAVETDTQDIQARLPAALTVAGNIKADVEEVNAVTIIGDGSGTPFNV
jgi:hypothetical protein